MKLTIQEIQTIETEMLKEVSEICEKHSIDYYLAYGSMLGAVRHGGPIPWDTDIDIVIPYNQLEKFIKIVRDELSEKFYVDFHDTNINYNTIFPRIGLKGHTTSLLHVDVFVMCGMPDNKDEQEKHFKTLRKTRRAFVVKKSQLDFNEYRHIKRNIIIILYKIYYLFFSSERMKKKFYKLCEQFSYDNSEFIAHAGGGYGLKEILKKDIFGAGSDIKYSGVKSQIPEKYDEYLRHFYGNYMEYPPENERQIKESYTIVKLDL